MADTPIGLEVAIIDQHETPIDAADAPTGLAGMPIEPADPLIKPEDRPTGLADEKTKPAIRAIKLPVRVIEPPDSNQTASAMASPICVVPTRFAVVSIGL